MPDALHLGGHMHHFVEAGSNQPAETDQVAHVLARATARICSQGTITPRSITS